MENYTYITGSNRNLSGYLLQNLITEGGIAGHMRHPIDYVDFTGKDLIELVESIFTGKIERLKEKLDGTNINAYRNLRGEVRFIRNQGDLNSEDGGMSIEGMATKWASKPSVADNFIRSGKIIEEVFEKVPVKFFNPDNNTKVIVNCECISEGTTNVMVYPSDRVAFHGTSTYTKTDYGWELTSASEGCPSEISSAAEHIKGTEPRPDLILKSVEEGEKLAKRFAKEIEKIFREEGLSISDTIDTWKEHRFANLCPSWLDPKDVYRRFFYGDKSIGLTTLKKKYSEYSDELKQLDSKGYKKLVQEVMEPMDRLFFKIGNSLIENLKGFTNDSNASSVQLQLKKNLDELVADIRKDATEEEAEKLERQLNRLNDIGNVLNSAEGVVFLYKNRLMKLTGSFSALNQIMGLRKFSR